MLEAENSQFQNLISNLKSSNREEKLLSILALGILGIEQHSGYLVDLLASPDEEIVKTAIQALGKIGNPTSVKYLVEFIVEDKKLAEVAFVALDSFNFISAVDVLIKTCSSDQPNQIRRCLLTLLAKYEDVKVASLMNEILGQTRDPELLVLAINYFVKYPSSERHTPLKMLADNNNWTVSLAANLALSRLKDEGAFAHIRRLVKSSNAEVRQTIAESLASHPIIEDRSIFEVLFEDLRPKIREIATKGFILFGSDERITILHQWLKAESDAEIRLKLFKIAKAEKSPLLYDEFYKYLQVSDDRIRDIIISTIAEMGEDIADRIIIDFEKMSLVIKEQMILVLGKLGNDKAVKIIKSCLYAKERWLSINAIESCAYIENEELKQELLVILKSKEVDIWVRATTVSVLGRIGDLKIAEDIVEQITHDDARVRANAIEALSNLKWPGLIEICKESLHDRNDRVRVNSAIALWKCGQEDIFLELERMSRDKSRWVRASAAFALGKISSFQCTPILIKMLRDSEDIVYRNTIEALSAYGDMRAMLPLLIQFRSGRLSDEFYQQNLQKFTDIIYDKANKEN